MGKKILVVDDDNFVRNFHCTILKQAGYDVHQAVNGKEGLSVYGKLQPEAVVTDYSMPLMNGGDLIRELKQLRVDLPVVLITGEATDAILLSLLQYGRFTALHKPTRPALLLQAIEHVISTPYQPEGPAQRKHFRMDTEISGELEGMGTGVVRSISVGGLYIEIATQAKLGDEVKLTLQFPEVSAFEGEVVWVKQADNDQKLPPGLGIRFTSVPAESQRALEVFLCSELSQRKIGWFDGHR